MRDWRIESSLGSLTVEADTEEAARQEAIVQIQEAAVRVWHGWTVIDLPSGSVAIRADTEENARQEAIRQITNASVRRLKYWIVDLGSFVVEAADENEAYTEARKRIDAADDIEIDQIFENE